MASPSPEPSPAPTAKAPGATRGGRRWLARLAKLGCSVLLLFIMMEGAMRVALFHDHQGLRKKVGPLRSASNFAHRWSPEYWKLLRLFARGPRSDRRYDPIVGWMPSRIESGTYDHRDHDPSNGKRPILLYGDSFAECVTGSEACWEGLLERSELGSTHQLLNYGAGGFGFDQTFLLLRESIANYAEEDPIVIVSVLVDDDLDRSILPFRSWPKPRLEIRDDGSIGFDGPVHEDTLGYLDEHPPAIRSYLWRYLLHGTKWIPGERRNRWMGKAEAFETTRQLNRRILEEVQVVLESAGVEAFVMLFHGKGFFREGVPETWREGFLLRELERLELPFVSSRTTIDGDMARTGRTMEDYFQLKGNGKGHYDAEGNQIVFETFLRGLRGEFEGVQPGPDPIDAPSTQRARGKGAFARFGSEPVRPFTEDGDTPRWVLAAGPPAPTELSFRLRGAVRGFSATLKQVPARAHVNGGPVALTLIADGETLLEYQLVATSEPIPIEVGLEGVHELRILASSPEGAEGVVLVLASPEFHLH